MQAEAIERDLEVRDLANAYSQQSRDALERFDRRHWIDRYPVETARVADRGLTARNATRLSGGDHCFFRAKFINRD